MKGFSVSDILGNAPVTKRQEMRIMQIDFNLLDASGWNASYRVDELDLLSESILQQGLQQPLLIAPEQDGKHVIISGHRRYAAILHLREGGYSLFDLVPCIIQENSGQADSFENRLRLILANATSREMTDWDKLQQYKELKALLAEGKKEGQVQGKVRNAVARTLNMSTGQAGRYDVILKYAPDVVLNELQSGNKTITATYLHASKVKEIKDYEARQENSKGEALTFTHEHIIKELIYGFWGENETYAKEDAINRLNENGIQGLIDLFASFKGRDWQGYSMSLSQNPYYAHNRMAVPKKGPITLTADNCETKTITFAKAADLLVKYFNWIAPKNFNQLQTDQQCDLFLDSYETWNVVVDVPQLALKVYDCNLNDDTRIIISVFEECPKRTQLEYRLRNKYDTYGTATCQRQDIIEHLKKQN